uniref:Histone H2A C-terminal domain-containing protein n=1 Tax=Amphilophus citrinellus TaxID=61819 RepID=A0A3Q0RU38_AMPCI
MIFSGVGRNRLHLLVKPRGRGPARPAHLVGLQYPVGCVHRLLCKSNYVERVGMTHIELNKLLSGVTFTQGGVLPKIQAVLLPKKDQDAC